MKLKHGITIAVLVLWLALTIWLGKDRLEREYYQKGVRDGRKQMVDQVVNQVENTGTLTVTMPDGQRVLLRRIPPIRPAMDPNDVKENK